VRSPAFLNLLEFLAASFARNRRFRDLFDVSHVSGCGSGGRDGEYSDSARSTLAVNVYQNETWSTLGNTCYLVFEYRLGLCHPVGPTPSPRPRRAQLFYLLTQHRAALCGAIRQSPNRRIADRIQSRHRHPGRRRVCRFRFGIGGVRRLRVSPAVCRAGTRRCTGPRPMANPKRSKNCCCAAPTWLSRTLSGNAALRRTAEPNAQPRACRNTPKQWAEQRGKLAQYEAAETQVHVAACTPPQPATPCLVPHPSPERHSPTDVPPALAVRRRSPIQRGGRRPPTCGVRP
jgi:hypothetical protein